MRMKRSFRMFLLMLSMLATASYANTGRPLNYMESAQHSLVLKGLVMFAVLTAVLLLLLTKQALNSKRTVFVGALLTIYGLMLASVWFVNYMIIGMGLIALSGVILAFKNGMGKLVYLLGALFISVFASIEFGASSRDFIRSVAFLYLIGVLLFLFVPDDEPLTPLSYKDERPITPLLLAQLQRERVHIRDNAENASLINVKKVKQIIALTCGIIILLTLIVVAYRIKT